MGQNIFFDIDREKPKKIFSERIVYMACGENHCIFLKEDGDVIGMGSNKFGELV